MDNPLEPALNRLARAGNKFRDQAEQDRRLREATQAAAQAEPTKEEADEAWRQRMKASAQLSLNKVEAARQAALEREALRKEELKAEAREFAQMVAEALAPALTEAIAAGFTQISQPKEEKQ